MLCDRDKVGLEESVEKISSTRADGTGSVLDSTTIDIADFDAVATGPQRVLAEHGAPAQVFHATGIAIWGDPRTLPHEKWTKVIDINLMGTVHLVEAWTPSMAAAGKLSTAEAIALDGPKGTVKGRVRRRRRNRNFLAVSSAAGIIGLPWHAAYSASKGGVQGMCEVLRFDLAQFGASVHVTVPGAVDTPLVLKVDINGVDRSQPRVAKLASLLQGRSIIPEQAAEKIISGVNRGKYLIPTSMEVPVARYAQLLAPWAYRGIMRGLNRSFR